MPTQNEYLFVRVYIYIYIHNILHNIFSKRTLARATTEECITCVVTFFKYHIQTRTNRGGPA